MSTEVDIPDLASFQEGIANTRSDSNSINWVLAGHINGNPNALEYRSSGSGGLEELESLFTDDEVMYALVRFEEVINMSITIKFGYIHWVGNQVTFVKRGKYGVVHGSISKYFDPYHFNVEASSREDLTKEAIMKIQSEQSGTKSKVTETSEAATRKDHGFTSSGNIVKTGQQMSGFAAPSHAVSLKFDDGVIKAIADVRSDDTQTDWCVAEYEANNPKNPIVLRGQGADSVDGIKGCLEEDRVAYALLRVSDVVDGIPTVKFVYVQWVGERVKPMVKAKISTNKSSVEKVFSPFHVIIYATSPGELAFENIKDKVSSASGSKSHVKK